MVSVEDHAKAGAGSGRAHDNGTVSILVLLDATLHSVVNVALIAAVCWCIFTNGHSELERVVGPISVM